MINFDEDVGVLSDSGLLCAPRYIQLHGELRAMCRLRRWLSFKMREELRVVDGALMYEMHFRHLDRKKARQEQEIVMQDWEKALLEDRVWELETVLSSAGEAE